MAEKLIWDFRTCDDDELSAQDRLLCEYAVKLTLTPGAMNEEDVARVRAVGLTEGQSTVAVQVIGYFNYINRVADGLEVQLEDWMLEHSKEEWLKRKACFQPKGLPRLD